jgi:phosphate transport system substrate-binding protein
MPPPPPYVGREPLRRRRIQMPRIGRPVRITLALVAVAAAAALAAGTGSAAAKHSTGGTVNGAGSTFVAPLVSAWVDPVKSALGITLNYNPIGSGGGVSAITQKQVDFGASDAPLSQFSPTCTSCVQIPWALAATAVIYHIHGVPGFLHLTGSVLAKIYMGQITHWDDPAIQHLNSGTNLPHTAITVVHRSDSSGTTYNFTDYLSHVSRAWKNGPGTGTSVNWPTGVGEAKSSGVAGTVKSTDGAIGYVDVDYAKVNHINYFRMKNRSGQFVLPRLKGIIAAAQLDTHPAKDGSLSIVNPPKSRKYHAAYPISTYTYVDVQKHSGANAKSLKKLIKWAITKGDPKYGPKLFFAPLPKAVITFDEQKQLPKIKS